MNTYWAALTVWSLWMGLSALCMVSVQHKVTERMHELPMGPSWMYIPRRVAWSLMTLPSLPSIVFFYGLANDFRPSQMGGVSGLFVALYCLHYVYRSLVYPQRIRAQGQQHSVLLVLATWLYYIPMGYFMGTYFAAVQLPMDALQHPATMAGLVLFIVGLCSTMVHDDILIRLRDHTTEQYSIPRRGLFRYCSNAHYFSELVEWFGFALLTGAIPALVHLVAVFVLMLPQAFKTHQWYRARFGPQYPKGRTAFIPFVL